jgi:hypothetical protein
LIEYNWIKAKKCKRKQQRKIGSTKKFSKLSKAKDGMNN